MVIDSTDRERLSVTREELYRMLSHEELSKASVLIFANKQVSFILLEYSLIVYVVNYLLILVIFLSYSNIDKHIKIYLKYINNNHKIRFIIFHCLIILFVFDIFLNFKENKNNNYNFLGLKRLNDGSRNFSAVRSHFN